MNVLFVQPALPRYRVPFFAELQRRAACEVRVWSDHQQRLVPFCDPAGQFLACHYAETAIGPMLSQPALMRAVRDPWSDVVVLPWNSRYLQLVPALLEARLRHKPVVVWGHGYSKRYSPWKHRARNAVGALADACVTYSESTRLRLVAEGLDAAKVFCAPNALDGAPIEAHRQYWRTHPRELDELRLKLGIRSGKVVLFVSRLEPDKRTELLIDAFWRVAERVTDVQLVVVGDGSEFERLRSIARARGIDERVVFVGALYDEHVLGGIFTSATVFAYPVAVGLSIVHALNYGLPVVTSDNPDCHNPEFDVLMPGHNSLLYHHDVVEDFAARLEHVVQSPKLQARLGAGALESVRGPHGRTLQAMADGMLAALRYASRSSRSGDSVRC